MEDVFKVYSPTTEDDKALYRQQQNFCYSVFERTIKTYKTMKFLQEHEDTRDAHAIYKKFLATYEEGILAQLRE